MNKTNIALDLLLPAIPNTRDACVDRIISLLQNHKGIQEVHLKIPADGSTPQLCFHFNPALISIKEVERIARQEGAGISSRYAHFLAEVSGLRDLNAATALENELTKLKGLAGVSVSGSGHVRAEYDTTFTHKAAIEEIIRLNNLTLISTQTTTPSAVLLRGKKPATPEIAGTQQKEDHQLHDSDDDHDHGHSHGAAGERKFLQTYGLVILSAVLLLTGIAFDAWLKPHFFAGRVRLLWYAVAYIPVGWPVARQGIRLLLKGDVFTEFVLMTLATIGAFAIGEYPEGVAVMLFYTIGELFQDAAVNRARRSIKALLDIRPATANLKQGESIAEVDPATVQIGDTLLVKAGEKVPLDGEMLSAGSTFNTAALTGESRPTEIAKGEAVLAGMINGGKPVELRVTKLYNDSSLARILTLVQEATTRKAKTEQFIRKFSRVYTPIVVFLAIGIALLPYFFVENYVPRDWLYRALIFLVISCPCALVISIPLGYFGGIGAASRKGILFKGSNFLDLMTKVTTVVMDKTGTLTKGVFKVQEVRSYGLGESQWLPLAAALEKTSTHPIAQAVVEYAGGLSKGLTVSGAEEISGHGLRGTINGQEVLAGNAKLLDRENISVPEEVRTIKETIVVVAVANKFAGYVTIADEIKEDSPEAIQALHRRGIETVMLSGDKQAVVTKVATTLGIENAFGDLLPEDKVSKVESIKKDPQKVVAFVGDGINDAPVLALSDVGMAMGGLGSDAAIETADVIIQTDNPSRIALAIEIGKATNRVVWQNIIFAFVVKGIVLLLGAGGLATMWEAVFADVGVALLAVFNAMRIQRMKFED